MRYLVIITLTILFAGCITINKTYLPAAKKDTVYLPCNKIHIQSMPSTQWDDRVPFYPFYRQQHWDTSYMRLDTSKTINGTIRVWGNDSVYIINDTLRKLYDTTNFFGGGGYSIPDSIRVRKY